MDERQETLTLNRADALALLKRAPVGTRFVVSCYVELPIADDPGKVFPGYAGVRVSRADAIQTAGSLLSETLDERGGRLTIRVHRPDASSKYSRHYYYIG